MSASGPVLLVLGHLWAAPLTLLGLLAALVGGGRWLGLNSGVLEFTARTGGLISWVFRATGTCGASGLWGCVAFYAAEPSAQIRRHEHVHARQAMALGALWPLAYGACALWALTRGGHAYRDNAMERAARAAE
jgi:hypothetical protein